MSARSTPFRLITLICLLALSGMFAERTEAQFLNIQIDVEPRADAQVERSLDFGTIVANSGLVNFELGDPGMGIFAIRALRTQRMLFSFEVPDYLHHDGSDNRIPAGFQLAITDTGVNDYRQAAPIIGTDHEIIISSPPGQPDREWSFAWIYVYGWIDVGNVPPGIYTADLVLHVEYD